MKITIEITQKDYERLKELMQYYKDMDTPEFAASIVINHWMDKYLDRLKARKQPQRKKPIITLLSAIQD